MNTFIAYGLITLLISLPFCMVTSMERTSKSAKAIEFVTTLISLPFTIAIGVPSTMYIATRVPNNLLVIMAVMMIGPAVSVLIGLQMYLFGHNLAYQVDQRNK